MDVQWASAFEQFPSAGFGDVPRSAVEDLFGSNLQFITGAEHMSVVHDGDVSALRIRYIPDSTGSTNAATPVYIPSSDDVTLSYSVFFEPGWEFVKGGKLPGLCGGERATGGVGGYGDGFSTRFMWRAEGRLIVYNYHPDRPSRFGDDIQTSAQLNVGEWIDITQRVTMNTPGQSDGRVRAWVNDELVVDESGFRWSPDGSFDIDKVCFSTFFGGSNSKWSPSKTVFARFANFVVTHS